MPAVVSHVLRLVQKNMFGLNCCGSNMKTLLVFLRLTGMFDARCADASSNRGLSRLSSSDGHNCAHRLIRAQGYGANQIPKANHLQFQEGIASLAIVICMVGSCLHLRGQR